MRVSMLILLFFVSQECQRADWKRHKHVCGFRGPVKAKHWQSNLVTSWRKRNIYLVLAELNRVMCQRNVTAQEVFLELDFMVREGVAPALQDPPDFKIKLVREFTEGNRPALPDWCLLVKGTAEYETKIQGLVKYMQICSEKISDGELLVYSRYDEVNVGFTPLRMVKTWCRSEVSLVCEVEILIASPQTTHHDDDSLLEEAAPPAPDVVHKILFQCR